MSARTIFVFFTLCAALGSLGGYFYAQRQRAALWQIQSAHRMEQVPAELRQDQRFLAFYDFVEEQVKHLGPFEHVQSTDSGWHSEKDKWTREVVFVVYDIALGDVGMQATYSKNLGAEFHLQLPMAIDTAQWLSLESFQHGLQTPDHLQILEALFAKELPLDANKVMGLKIKDEGWRWILNDPSGEKLHYTAQAEVLTQISPQKFTKENYKLIFGMKNRLLQRMPLSQGTDSQQSLLPAEVQAFMQAAGTLQLQAGLRHPAAAKGASSPQVGRSN